MSRKRVIIVGQFPPPIHGQSVAIERIANIKSDDWEIVSLPMNCSSDIESVGRFQLGKIWTTLKVAFNLRKLLREDPQALVYYPPASPASIPVIRDMLFFLVAGSAIKKSIFHFHAGGLPEFLSKVPWGGCAKAFYPKPAVCISMSRDSDLSPGRFYGAEDVYIPYGLEIPIPFEPRPQQNPCRLLFVGNLFISKGVEICLRAVRSLVDQGVSLHLDLVGGHVDKDKQRVLDLVDELNVGEHVTFHGVLWGEAKWERFKAADCFVFPSHYPAEKFPNVLIEALGSGLPVVSTKWRGIPELVGADCTGSELVEIEDQSGFEAAVFHIVTSRGGEYVNFRNAARQRYEQRYTLETFTESVLGAFDKAYHS